jgi:hypothetical protein
MTNSSRPGGDRPNDWVVLFRVFVFVPAFATLLAVGASALFPRGPAADRRGEVVELTAAGEPLSLGEPSYGPVLTNVVSVTDAVETPRGWAVLDRRAQQLVFLDPTGAFVAVAGRHGQGPGELADGALLARVDSTLVVVDAGGNSLDLFGMDGAFRDRVPLRTSGCAGARVTELIGETEPLVMLSVCTRLDGKTAALVERVTLTGDREAVVDTVYHDLTNHDVDPTSMPLLVRARGILHFVITPDRCVTILEADEQGPDAICHPDRSPLAMPDSVQETFRTLEPRIRALGGTLSIPDRFPPFDRILSIRGNLAFHVMLDDSTHALEVTRGQELERILLPRARFLVGDGTILFAQDRLEGTAFAVLPLP